MRALAFSGGKDSMACLHLMRDSLDCAIYVDTGYAYPETLALVEYAATIFPVHTVKSTRKDWIAADIVPADWMEIGQQFTSKKPVTVVPYYECCFESLGRPIMDKAIALGVTELVYGQRNDESHKATSRDGDMVCGIKRLHPIESWTADEVMAYLSTKMDIPAHYVIKHSSLDCYDCTAYQKDSVDRIEWTRMKHPEFHDKYLSRMTALNSAINEANYG